MSKNEKSTKNWDKLWNEYTTALEKWRVSFQSLQKTSSEVQTKYNEVMEKALHESSQSTMNQFLDSWKNAMNKSGLNALKQFGENWQKSMDQSGMGQLKTYGEMMTKFAETWEKMWRK
jgi:phage shock protein A